ncbi:recombinase family protein [Sulfurimonas aquatica]|uniref:Recombinase family protein n=1 Tax=Sulfurimonas aquatica TaxID=2672570 RepID=A0A975AZZ7_9BACT|nr:recombinase family protein [Sulfurimonas aquatica]QSZ41610.1 recombinase family protein [Sulfurimonas aquatica]
MYVGYARVSTSSQNLENQIDQLKDAGCVKIFSEKKSGKNKADRQEFNIMMDFVREGDILFITKLDRLARSVIDLQNIAEFERDLINERVREGIEAAKKKGVQFGRKAILDSKEKNVIYKEHEKGKSVAWLSKFFHVARNTIYRAIKDVAKKK